MIEGVSLVHGSASGPLLVSDTGLSFWGGVDPMSGNVIDQHHPLHGINISQCVLAIPSGRGSCSGSGALLELILNDHAPAALVFSEAEDILTLGVMVATAMFERTLPVLRLSRSDFDSLRAGGYAKVCDHQLLVANSKSALADIDQVLQQSESTPHSVTLSELDKNILTGEHGEASRIAMDILLNIATIQGADSLIDVTQAHIDACVYNGPSSLRFAEALLKRGAKFKVPTTLNAISVDQRNWREHGIPTELGQPSSDLGSVYMDMGAQMSYTCAPYLLDTAPAFGEQVVWAESNAVMFANSVLGARTQKYPDFLDVFIALTGRAPASGSHLDTGRQPTVCIEVDTLSNSDDALWPLLGYHIGLHAGNDIPMIIGLSDLTPDSDDLKAFSAAYATTGSSSMFHMLGITPEANEAMDYCIDTGMLNLGLKVTKQNLINSFHELNSADATQVDAVCLGNPHFSVTECAKLSELCTGLTKSPDVKFMVTLGRAVYERASLDGRITELEKFGVHFITDTCWCMITDPLIPPDAKSLMTNSGKYAHYGPGLVKRGIHFGTLAECVAAACTGSHNPVVPKWLQN